MLSIGHCRYGADLAKQLTTCLLSVFVSCGSVRISFSDGTPEKVLPADTQVSNKYFILSGTLIPCAFHQQQVSYVITKELGNNPKVYIWDGQGKY